MVRQRKAANLTPADRPGDPAACHDGGMDAVNVDAVLASFAEHWSPKRIARVNGR